MDDTFVTCAVCHGDNLHQERYRVFTRAKEDGDVRIITVTSEDIIRGGDPTENPSSRRDGIIIYLSCENCNHETKLKIYQHKGTTFVETE